jgi:predicted metal-binding transcription factor (methanogenesis marker protein 9)
MKCCEVSALLEQYIMNDLDKCTMNAVEKHLHECNICTSEFIEIKQVIDFIRNLNNNFNPEEDVLIMSKRNISRNINRGKGHRRNLAPAAVACLSIIVCALTISFLIFPSFAYKCVPDFPVVKELEDARRQNTEFKRLNDEIIQENQEIKKENMKIKEQLESVILENERIKMQLKEISGEQITEVVTSEGVSEADNNAIQNLVIDFIKAMYTGDLETIKALGTDNFNTQLDRTKDHILMNNEGLVIFRTITNAAFHDGKYMVFVRVNDTNSEGEADYQWNFELLKVDGKFLVDFVGLDA